MLRQKRLRWLGHVSGMGTEHIHRQLLICKRKGGKQTAGGQRLRWADIASKDLKKCQIDKDWREIAQYLNGWTAEVQKVVHGLNMEARVEKLYIEG